MLEAIDPLHAMSLLRRDGSGGGFLVLGAVFLVVTGGEALYADMGHFGRRPIRLTWFGLVLPSLLINYFGQGAMLIAHPRAIEHPFYVMAPRWAPIPLIGLTTVATMIASQAVISGAFSLTRQAIQLGYLPRLRIKHTRRADRPDLHPGDQLGAHGRGVGLVLGFRSYQPTGGRLRRRGHHDMVFTTLLFVFVARQRVGVEPLVPRAPLVARSSW